jgi:hypothetical protein
MLYELRIYTMHPGRMDAINRRFADHTLDIFKRLGIKVADFWLDGEGRPKLYYVLEYKDLEDRNRKWEAFQADAEWVEVKRKSQEDGSIVDHIEEIFMKRADYFKK